MTGTSLNAVLEFAARRGMDYLDAIRARRVGPCTEALAALRELREPMPNVGTDATAVVEQLDRLGSAATVASTGGRYFGFVTGGTLPAALAANWLASAWDQESGLEAGAPGAALIEDVAHRWLVELFGFPPTTGTGFATGATMANFTALAAARGAILAKAGWDVEANGLQGAPRVHLYVGEEAHPSIHKALGMLGLGRDTATRLPVDRQGRIRIDELPSLAAPAIVCAQAGNANSGACDPFDALADWAHAAGAWLHVDGAFGLWAKVAPARAHLVAGVERADSWATDAHKWLNTPYDCGLAFVRNGDHLRRAMAVSASYFPPPTGRQPDQHTPELSRRARGIEVWAALKSLGRVGLAEMIERCCVHASRFAQGLSTHGFEVLNEVVLNQVVVKVAPNAETTDRIIDRIQQDGTCWVGGTTWRGTRAIRISVCSWATTADDVERSVAAIARAAQDQ